MELTDNLNIKQFKPLIAPNLLKDELPVTDQVAGLVARSRKAVQDTLTNKDQRRIVIVGPCSLHDCQATLEYAEKLRQLQQQVNSYKLICKGL